MKLFKSKRQQSFALPISDFKQFYAEMVPQLLERYHCFLPSFLERLASEYLTSGKCAKFTDEDLCKNVTSQQAALALNHCQRIASGRYNNSTSIFYAKSSGARSVSITIDRPCKSCAKVPKNKTYKADTDIPLYPCLDCDQDDICVFWYKINF
jgi:hypothetical protein